jgi:hypothetical protein
MVDLEYEPIDASQSNIKQCPVCDFIGHDGEWRRGAGVKRDTCPNCESHDPVYLDAYACLECGVHYSNTGDAEECCL